MRNEKVLRKLLHQPGGKCLPAEDGETWPLCRNSETKGERSSVANRAAKSSILQGKGKKRAQEERMGLQKW